MFFKMFYAKTFAKNVAKHLQNIFANVLQMFYLHVTTSYLQHVFNMYFSLKPWRYINLFTYLRT